MNVGVLRETKDHECRVAATPAGVAELVRHGHHVLVEAGAGVGSGLPDPSYAAAGAIVIPDRQELVRRSEMIVKVKEPQPQEWDLFHEGQILFAYLHLAPNPALTKALLERGVIAVAYETVQLSDGSLPLLAPMSQIAGRLSVQAGAMCLESAGGGCGILLGGVPGVPPAHVVILGGGTVGYNAARIAVGMGAHVTMLDKSVHRLTYLDDIFRGAVATVAANQHTLAENVAEADLLIGAVLVPGSLAPRLVTRDMVKTMGAGTVIVDVAVDQGGCCETTRPTTYSDPTYVVEGVVHYCVANIPGAVPRTATLALTNATLRYILEIADRGIVDAARADESLASGINLFRGTIACEPVATSQKRSYTPLPEILAHSVPRVSTGGQRE